MADIPTMKDELIKYLNNEVFAFVNSFELEEDSALRLITNLITKIKNIPVDSDDSRLETINQELVKYLNYCKEIDTQHTFIDAINEQETKILALEKS